METNDLLRSLFAAMFAYTREKLRGKATADDISSAVRSVLESMQIEEQQISWADAPTISVTTAKRRDALYRAVYLLAHVTHLDEPKVGYIPGEGDKMTREDTICGRVTGLDGELMDLLPAIGSTVVQKLQEARREGGLVRITGLVVSVPARMSVGHAAVNLGNVGQYALHVIDLQSTTSTLDLLGATPVEREETRQLLDELRADGVSPFTHLTETVIEGLGVVGRTEIPEIYAALRFVVLQAVSSGFVGTSPGRLHLELVGPPGQGKKLVSLAARALNPVAREASATKVSPAGLVGASYQTGKGWASTPGLLPLASEGVLVVQDAHGWSRSQVGKLAPIFQELMEEGVVRDSVAGGTTHVARTALVIDANRHGQLGGIGGHGEAPILTVVPIISRLDCMIEIPLDVGRSWRVGAEMYGTFKFTAGGDFERQPWVRRARLLVALLRDEHPEIDDSGATAALREAHCEIEQANHTFMQTNPVEASAIAGRMVISLTRLVRASARAHDRKVATTEDAGVALEFFRYKLNFMKMAIGRVRASDCPGGEKRQREAYYARYAGQEVTAKDVQADVERDLGQQVTDKTIRRDLGDLGATKQNGRWLLPPRKAS